jgi:hypothetical protein
MQLRGSGAPLEEPYHQLLIAPADGYLLVVDLHVRGGKGADLVFRYDERPVNADEIIF